MADESLQLRRDGSIATITIDRPGAYNALNSTVLRGLSQAVDELVATGARAIIITGSGERAFSAGADLKELEHLDAAASHDLLADGQRAMSTIEASPVPVLAAVNGLALGGGFELILACTFPILADHASLGLPESGLGLIPGYGGTQRLPAIIGKAAAAHVMLTGTRLSAQRCYELGLTPMVPVPLAELAETVRQTAETIVGKGPRAQSAILSALRATAPSRANLALESALAGLANGGAESSEGVAAFNEKRAPRFNDARGI